MKDKTAKLMKLLVQKVMLETAIQLELDHVYPEGAAVSWEHGNHIRHGKIVWVDADGRAKVTIGKGTTILTSWRGFLKRNNHP